MTYIVRSAGAWGDPAGFRLESAERLAHALAIFGAEATLRERAGVGTVSLIDAGGVELLAYHAEQLAVTVATGRDPAPGGVRELWWVQRVIARSEEGP